ncbi:MAG: hypothetical protein GF335_00155 [Candidatus Moranbacteria bacterium]|nr:hypothetical protein [Candidatus Moranbacteria bacterium]
MINLELVLNILAEASTNEILKDKSRLVAKQGGGFTKKAREEIKKNTGRNVVTN